MNIGRLKTVVDDLLLQYNEQGLVDSYSNFSMALRLVSSSPSEEQMKQFEEARRELFSKLRSSVVNSFGPARTAVVREIGGGGLTGLPLWERIATVLHGAFVESPSAVDEIDKILSDSRAFHKMIARLQSSFVELGIEGRRQEPGQFECAIRIPCPAGELSLDDVSSISGDWNKALRPLQEAVGDGFEDVAIKGLGLGSVELIIGAGVGLAWALVKISDKLLDVYKKVLEVRELRLRLQALKAPVTEQDQQVEHERVLVRDAIDSLVAQVLDKSRDSDVGRINELRTGIRLSIEFVASEIDSGVEIEVTGGLPVDPESDVHDEENEALAETICKLNNEMRDLPRAEGVVLRLPPANEGEGSD